MFDGLSRFSLPGLYMGEGLDLEARTTKHCWKCQQRSLSSSVCGLVNPAGIGEFTFA